MKVKKSKVFNDLEEILKSEIKTYAVYDSEYEFAFSFHLTGKYQYVIMLESCDNGGIEITSIIYKEGIEIQRAFFTDYHSACEIWYRTIFNEIGINIPLREKMTERKTK